MAATQATKHKKGTVPLQTQKDSSDSPRVAIGEEGNIVYASPEFCQLADIDFYQAPGTSISKIMTFPDLDDDGSFAIKDIITNGIHNVLLGSDEKSATFNFEWVSMPDGNKYLVGSAGDQIQSAKYENILQILELQRSEADSFLDLSHDSMVEISLEGSFIKTNDTFRMLSGYDDRKLRDFSFTDLIFPDDRHSVRTFLRSLAHSDDPGRDATADFEARVIDSNGNIHWMDWRLKRKGRSIFCVGLDQTSTKNHEIELLRREQQLSEAESIGRMGHWYWRVGEELISFSDEALRIFGGAGSGFKPTLDGLGERIHRRDIGRLLQAFQRAILEKNDYDMDFRVIHPDNSICYVRCRGRCEKDAEGEVIGLFGIMQDITERTIHEISLREAKEASERAYAAKSQFLANMSHELRTPLNAIIGFSEMMQRQLLGPIGTEKYLEYIDGIRQSGEHLLDLISDILNMSKIEAGKYDLELGEVNLPKLIHLALHMVEGKAREAGLHIGYSLENEDIVIIADRRAILQILLNLLSNSVKFTRSGGNVKVECAARDGYISLKVTDTGIGIPANKLSSVTKPFEQVASHYTREYEGTGLGLAITKELVEMHGGSIHIDSTVGVGTTVSLRLPLDASPFIKDVN